MRAILAIEKHGGIGYRGAMPWPKQDKDLARFKELTTGTTIIMGRGTWDSQGMPKPLPDRINVVVSTRDLDLPANVIHIKDLASADLSSIDWCIGGAGLIDSLWDQINEMHITRLRGEYDCDVSIDLARLSEDFYLERSQLCLEHTYEIWRRRVD